MRRRKFAPFAFAWKMRSLQLSIAGLLVLAFVALQSESLLTSFHKWFTENWNKSFNAYAGISTLLVALAVWYSELAQEWRESLPNKLTVSFLSLGQPIMVCRYAHLAHVSDARALAQQIGSQMAAGAKLKMRTLEVRQSAGVIETNDRGDHHIHYTLEIDLLALPETLRPGRKLPLVWEPPFERLPTLADPDGAEAPRPVGAP